MVSTDRRRVDLAFLPDFRASNPYQRMLYAGAESAGLAVVPLPRPTRSLLCPGADPETGYVFHLHWTNQILQAMPDRPTARARLDRFLFMLDQLAGRGARLLWTVHNVLPHECPYPELETRLCTELGQRADMVHVLNPATVERAALYYPLPADRVRIVPHSSYRGIYPDRVSRRAARARAGIRAEEVALLMIGMIRPYKGLDTLLDAFDIAVAAQPRLRLMIAGAPLAAGQAEALAARCGAHPRIVAHLDRVPDEELQFWLRAADLALFPSGSMRNSGSLLLALTFGLPVLAATEEREPPPAWLHPVLPDLAPAALAEALLAAVAAKAGRPEATSAAYRAAARYPPERMAADFLGLLGSLGLSATARAASPGRPSRIPGVGSAELRRETRRAEWSGNDRGIRG